MLWEELLLDRPVSDESLVRALSVALGLPEESIRVLDDVAKAPDVTACEPRLLVERSALPGDFPLQIGLYVRDAELEPRLQPQSERLARVKRLCGLLDAAGLLSDESPSPFFWLRVHPTGAVDAVTLDADHLDRDEYVVASAHPAKRPTVQTRRGP